MLRTIFAVAAVVATFASQPVPDTSEGCTSCQQQVQELQASWTNATTVEEILSNLETECRAKYHLVKKEICDKIVETIVKIPPKIFEGMEGLAWDIPIATCATIRKCTTNCCSADSVEQVHLSLASTDRSKMGVSWVTLDEQDTHVQYSANRDDFDANAAQQNGGSSNTYTSAGWIGTIHKAMMTDLKQATTYFYRVGREGMWSEIFSFKTYDPTQGVKFAVIADMGYGENSDNTVARLQALVEAGEVDIVLHNGDIGYADGYEVHWDAFLNKIEPIASRVPYQVTPGNHEFWYNFAAYKARFYMPSNADNGQEADGSGDNMYYSWEYGNVHFAAMNSETAVDEPDFHKNMLSWLQEDLSSVDRQKTPYVITHFHRPLYCSNDGQCTKSVEAPNRLTSQAEELLYEMKVDVVMTGHVHEYERTAPVYKGETASVSSSLSERGGDNEYAGPVYILQGSSGNREGNKGSWPADEDLPAWSLAHSSDIGYGVLRVSPSQSQGGGASMQWTFYRSEDDAALDVAQLGRG